MQFRPDSLSTRTAITLGFILIFTFASGYPSKDGNQETNSTLADVQENANSTDDKSVAPGSGASDAGDYEWSNDDHVHADINSGEQAPTENGVSEKPENKLPSNDPPPTTNSSLGAPQNISQSSNSTDTEGVRPNNSTELEQPLANVTQPEDVTTSSQKDEMPSPQNSTNNESETNSRSGDDNSDPVVTESVVDSDATTFSEEDIAENIPTVPEKYAVPITYQSAEDVSNYTTPASVPNEENGKTTWAIVVFSVLISFALLFTILYLIRGALIRKRKTDMKKLLRASSEGYFYGGELEGGNDNNAGKFEL